MQNLFILCFLLIIPNHLMLRSENPYDYSQYKSASSNQHLSYGTVTSSNKDESAVYITESIINIDYSNVNKESGDSTKIEESDLYGVNSAVLVQGEEGMLSMNQGQINAKAKGSNALFSTNGGEAAASQTIITSTGSASSRGLVCTYDGGISGVQLTVSTSGDSSPLAALYEGGKSIVCQGCTLSTKGKESDLIQTKGTGIGAILFEQSNGVAEKSKIALIDGPATINIKNKSQLKCNAAPIREGIDQSAVMLYQSNSRFSEGNTFYCEDSELEILESSDYYSTAPMFFVTNTGTAISINNCNFKFGSNVFLSVKATNEWGVKGSNGGDVTIQLTNQNIEGDFLVDVDSSLTIILKKSSIKGRINPSNTVKALSINIDRDSKITITGNSYCSIIINELQDGSNLINGSYHWTIGSSSNSAEGFSKSYLFIFGIGLILNILLL